MTHSVQVAMMWVYTHKTPAEFNTLEQAAMVALQKLEKKIMQSDIL